MIRMDVSNPGYLRNTQSGAVLALLLFLLGAIFCLVILVFFVFGKIVPPNMIGVRQNSFTFPLFGRKGYQPNGLQPGLHLKMPGISSIVLIPRDFQFINWNPTNITGDLALPSLNVPTDDGSKVNTDVTLIVRYFDKPEEVEAGEKKPTKQANEKVPLISHAPRSHGGPKELFAGLKDDRQKQLRTMAQKGEGVVKRFLGRLATTDYYNAAMRETAALEAHEEINRQLNPYGIELWATLIRRYVYAERTIDDQIFAKNLQEATERLNAEASKLSKAKANTEKTRADWDANKIQVLRIEGETQSRVFRSEGDLYEASKHGEGDLLVAEAVAKVDKAKAQALTDIQGADVYLGREMAPLLRTLSGGIVAGVDPYDIGKWLDKLIAHQPGTRARLAEPAGGGE